MNSCRLQPGEPGPGEAVHLPHCPPARDEQDRPPGGADQQGMVSRGGSSKSSCWEDGPWLAAALLGQRVLKQGQGVSCCLLFIQVTGSLGALYHVRNFTMTLLRYGTQLPKALHSMSFTALCAPAALAVLKDGEDELLSCAALGSFGGVMWG